MTITVNLDPLLVVAVAAFVGAFLVGLVLGCRLGIVVGQALTTYIRRVVALRRHAETPRPPRMWVVPDSGERPGRPVVDGLPGDTHPDS